MSSPAVAEHAADLLTAPSEAAGATVFMLNVIHRAYLAYLLVMRTVIVGGYVALAIFAVSRPFPAALVVTPVALAAVWTAMVIRTGELESVSDTTIGIRTLFGAEVRIPVSSVRRMTVHMGRRPGMVSTIRTPKTGRTTRMWVVTCTDQRGLHSVLNSHHVPNRQAFP